MHRFALLFLLAGAVSVWSATSEVELFSEAESRYLGGNYPAALEAYDDFLHQYPLSDLAADAQYRKAVCLYRLQRYSDSSALLHEIDTRYRSTRYLDYVPFWQGLASYRLKSYSLGVESLNAFLARAKDPELTPQALLYKALCLVELKDEPGAADALRALVKDYRGSSVFPYAAAVFATLLTRQKAFDELLQFTSSIDPSAFPQNWKEQFLLSRAEGLWEAGRMDEALPLYKTLTGGGNDVALTAYRRLFDAAERKADLAGMQALTQAADARFGAAPEVLADLWARVGAESFRKGDLDDARRFLTKVWDLRGTRAPVEAVPLYLAEISLASKDAAGARSILEQYLASPAGAGSAAAVMRLGDIALQTGDLAGAAGYYSRFIQTFPESPRLAEAGYLLAYVKYRQGSLDDSFALVSRFLAGPSAGQYRKDLLRLRIVLLKKNKNYREAAASLSDYVAQFPDDVRSRIDLLKTLFLVGDYPRIVQEADALFARVPGIASSDPYAYLLASYLRGLSLIAKKEYRGAIPNLEAIRRDQAEKAGLAGIVPYAGYYLGWAYVKSGSFDLAAKNLDALVTAYPGNEIASKTQFLAGWSHFSLGEFDRAADAFSRVAKKEVNTDLGQRSLYLGANSLFNAKKLAEASSAFQAIIRASPPSPYADRAMFDYAGVLSAQGATAKAADTYRSLAETYPSSPLAEEAVYKRAETYYAGAKYAEARSAFSDYRSRFPKGKLIDGALYWGGEAAASAGEKFGAVLLWGELIQGYKDSSFRAAAIRKSAEVYVESRDFASALRLYTQLVTEYPADARAAKADIIAEQLHYQILGLGDREAELTTRISRESGQAKTDATLELARLYILSGEKKVEQGYQMLQPIIAGSDPAAASRAQYLAGEYFYRKGDLGEASKRFLAAAAKGASDSDFSASSIYRAAEMMKLAGRQDDVQALAKRLADNFPASPWTAKARKLMEADR